MGAGRATNRAQPAPAVAVVGLGNPVRRDDGFGLRVADEVERLLQAEPLQGVQVLRSFRAGFELLDLLSGFSHAVIVDCLEVPRPKPGRVRRLSLRRVAGSARLTGQHEISIFEAFEFARRLGIAMPTTVVLRAVEAADTLTFSEEMSPEVAAAVGPLAREVLRIASEWQRPRASSARRESGQRRAAAAGPSTRRDPRIGYT